MLNQFLYDSINICYVLFSESIRYIYTRDYDLFIKNLVFNVSSINIFYTKLLQAFASNDYLDHKMNQYLIQITDNVPYKQEDIDKELLWTIQEKYNIHIFNGPKEEDIIPINSGSISLVFVDKEKKYAIKIKRKNIEKQMENTIHYLMFLSKIISYIPFLRKIRFHKFLQENSLKLYEQLDFQKEVSNMGAFFRIYKNIDYICIPEVLPHITEQYPNIIVSEYIDNSYRIESIPEDKKETFGIIILKIVFLGALKKYIHGDLHSGNILFTEKKGYPQIILLDFGIIFKLTNTFSQELFEFIYNLENYTTEKLSFIFLKSILNNSPKVSLEDKHITHILQYTTEITSVIKNKELFDMYDFSNCISKLVFYIENNNLKEYGIDLNQDYINLNIFIIMATTIASKLCKNNLLILVNNVLKEMFEFHLIS